MPTELRQRHTTVRHKWDNTWGEKWRYTLRFPGRAARGGSPTAADGTAAQDPIVEELDAGDPWSLQAGEVGRLLGASAWP